MQIDIAYIGIVIGVVLLSMTLHEAMHAYASSWLGDDTARAEGRLTLNPIAHIDPFLTLVLPLMLAVLGLPIFGGAKPVPFNPIRVRYGEFGAAIVGVAGPLTNFVLAFVFFAIYALSGTPGGLLGDFLVIAVFVNLGFFVFNMLPIPPLDGSRLLYAIAPDGAREVMARIEQNGLILIFALILLFSSQLGQLISTVTRGIISVFSGLFGLPVIQ
jgi:Zn-dependent protease